MLTIDQQQKASPASAAYQIRLHGGTDDERLVPIPPGKHSVGSGSRCQLRLSAEGVAAMECLLVRDRAGLRVRCWSDNTLLNGQPFEEAALADGDVLSVGPATLEIVGPAAGEMPNDASEDIAEPWEHGVSLHSACDAIDDMLQIEEATSQVLQPTEPNRDWQNIPTVVPARRGTDQRMDALAAAISASTEATRSTVRRRSRRALDVLRRQRRDHGELLARVDELERLLVAALAAPAAMPMEITPEQAPRLAEANERVTALESELAVLREQLAVRDGELQQARYTIDALECQLNDNQNTMNSFADERMQWEEQFNQIESRLAQYVERIQELEHQLESQPTPAQSASASMDDGNIDWAAEAGQVSTAAVPIAEAQEAMSLEPRNLEPEGQDIDSLTAAVETQQTLCTEEESDGDSHGQEVAEEPATEVSESAVETVIEPTLDSPAEPINVVESQAADATSIESQVDEALDHLRGLSIWREGPDPASQECTAADTSSVTEAPSEAANHKQPGEQPESFLDRYAHLFAEDEPPRQRTEPEDNTAPLTDAVPPPEVHSDEETVEQYMAKLLARMRTGPPGSSPASEDDRPNRPTTRIQASLPASEPEEHLESQTKFTNLEEMKSRAIAPEKARDMAAMRALANRSARHAIGIHAARKLRRTAITRVIVTALAASVSIYLLLNSDTWRSLAFGAGTAAGLVAVYWGFLTLGTLLKGFQLGAFDDLEDETTSDKSVAPPLPIDMEDSVDAATPATETDLAARHDKNESTSEAPGGTDVVEVS